MGITAQGFPNLVRKNKRTDLEALAHMAAEHEVALFLIGNPLHMSGDARPAGRVGGGVRGCSRSTHRHTGAALG